jgi:PQQ-dependent catabolism-associated CXXCW motif protein
MHIKSWLLPCLFSLSMPLAAAQDQTPESPLFSDDGYRIGHYRSPTPTAIDDARTLDTPALRRLLAQRPDAALLNVQAPDWRNGLFIEQQARMQIPGSHWLSNVGKGTLDAQWPLERAVPVPLTDTPYQNSSQNRPLRLR